MPWSGVAVSLGILEEHSADLVVTNQRMSGLSGTVFVDEIGNNSRCHAGQAAARSTGVTGPSPAHP